MDLFSVFKLFAYVNCLQIVNLEYVCISGPLAQSVERGDNIGDDTSSRLIRTKFQFLYRLLSILKHFRTYIAYKCYSGVRLYQRPVSSVGRG